MKFDIAIGNPPYQEQKGGTKNVDIWPAFLNESKKLAEISCMIHPGRWVIPTKTFQKRHDEILNSGLKAFNYFPNSADAFHGVDIDGGISVTVFETDYKDNITYYINGEAKGIYIEGNKFFSDNFEEEAYTKVFKNITTSMDIYIYGNIGSLSPVNMEQAKKLHDTKDKLKEPIHIYTSKVSGKGQSRYGWYYIEKDDLDNLPPELIQSRKVMLDAKGHSLSHGKGNVINNLPVICEKLATGDNVLWVIPAQDTDHDLELIKSLFMTKTARYLMCITQKSLCVRGFENIPDYVELAKLLSNDELFTDEWFYKTFNFSAELINEIETRVSPKIDKQK